MWFEFKLLFNLRIYPETKISSKKKEPYNK